MPYNDTKKDINVNYTNKDFSGLKNALIEYAKAYYPNTYRDFNETSPGMMLIEMSAYVGDVLNFYIDNQYRESMLPLADERRNIINLAKALGYKVKPSTTSFVDLKFTQTVGTTTLPDGNIVPNYTDAVTLDSNILVNTAGNTDLVFETLEEDGTLLLTEENLQLDEWALVQRAFDKVKRGASKMKGWVEDKVKGAMNWLKEFVELLLKKVKQALSKIVEMGKKALHALLKFFGFEPKNASGSGPAIIFHKMV